MNRRQLFKMLPLAGVPLAATKLLPASVLHEMSSKKRYLLSIKPKIGQKHLNQITEQLRAAGIENLILFSGDLEIFELEK